MWHLHSSSAWAFQELCAALQVVLRLQHVHIHQHALVREYALSLELLGRESARELEQHVWLHRRHRHTGTRTHDLCKHAAYYPERLKLPWRSLADLHCHVLLLKHMSQAHMRKKHLL